MKITCPHCQRNSQVAEQFLGKRIKCSGCGAPFIASVYALKTAPVADAPRLHIHPRFIILGALVLLLTLTILLYQSHPKKVAQQIAELQPQAEMDVKDVVERGLQAYMVEQGLFDMAQPRGLPHALEVSFLWSPMYWNLPETVGVLGATSQGAFGGNYHPRSGLIEVDVEVGGMGLPAVGAIRRGSTRIHVSGHVQGSTVSLELNGKPVTPSK